MTDTKAPLPAIGSRCWRDLISPESGATMLSILAGSSDADPLVELAYDEGGSGHKAAMPSAINQIHRAVGGFLCLWKWRNSDYSRRLIVDNGNSLTFSTKKAWPIFQNNYRPP